MIIFRWNGTNLSQFTVQTDFGTATVSGGKIVLTANSGIHNPDGLGFYLPKFIGGITDGFSVEMDMEVSSVGPGDGNAPRFVNMITNNTLLASQNVFPALNVGLAGLLDHAYDPDHFSTIRDANRAANPGISPTLISANTEFHYKQSINQTTGKHTVSINGDNFETNLGPTTSGGNYLGTTFASDVTKSGHWNNTTNPLTIVGGDAAYSSIATPFVSPDGFKAGRYYIISDSNGDPVETVLCTSVAGGDLTFSRGQFGTPITAHANGLGIYNKPEVYVYIQNASGGLVSRYRNLIVTSDGTYTPPAPTTLVATTGGEGEVSLTWADGDATTTNTDSILIERSTVSGSGFSQITTKAIGSQSHTDTGLTPGVEYFYRIRSSVTYNGSTVNSSYTSEASAESGEEAPGGGGGNGGNNNGGGSGSPGPRSGGGGSFGIVSRGGTSYGSR